MKSPELDRPLADVWRMASDVDTYPRAVRAKLRAEVLRILKSSTDKEDFRSQMKLVTVRELLPPPLLTLVLKDERAVREFSKTVEAAKKEGRHAMGNQGAGKDKDRDKDTDGNEGDEWGIHYHFPTGRNAPADIYFTKGEIAIWDHQEDDDHKTKNKNKTPSV
jgi:hypothetical protein